MYCKKCGKQIEDGRVICEECLQAEAVAEVAPAVEAAPVEAPVVAPAPVAAPAVEGKAKKKFGVLAMVFGIIAVYLMFSMLMAIPMAKEMIIDMMHDASGSNTIVYVADAAPAGAVFIIGGIFALAFCIPSMILGILSLVNSIKDLKAGVKSIACLVMSAVGIVLSILAFILFFSVISGAVEFISFFENYTVRG